MTAATPHVRAGAPAATEPRPRPIFCVIARHYHSVAEAEALCAGRYTHAGRTLDLGLPPDWRSPALPPDEEWRIEWWKFYGGLHLAHAYGARGHTRYLDTWRTLALSFLEQVPVGSDSSDVAARRIQNWIYAWDRFARAPSFPGLGEPAAARLLASLEAHVRWLRAHLSHERNHRTLELYALFVAALALPELSPDGELLRFAIEALEDNARTDILPDGVHRERSTHYHMIVLRSLVGVLENARRVGLTLSPAFRARVHRACDFALHVHRPDGEIPALSDSDGGGYLDLLALAGRLLGRDDLRFVASRGAQGRAPGRRHASFGQGGYHVQRSPWATPVDRTRYLVLDCGPVGDGGHGHYDALSVEVFASGRPLLVDPGRYTYAESEPGSDTNWRHAFKGTAAHNTVCVDGLDQTPYRRGKPRGGRASATFLGRTTSDHLDVIAGAVTSPAYPAIHRRRVLFAGDDWWVIEDRLASSEEHDYELRLHLAPEAGAELILAPGAGSASLAAGPALVHVAGIASARIEPGWVSREYGVRTPAPVLAARAPRARQAHLVTVLLPERGASVRVSRRGAAHAPSACLVERVSGETVGAVPAGTREIVAWSEGPDRLALGPVRVHARQAWVRLDAKGRLLAFEAHEVRSVSLRGRPQSPLARPGATVRWSPREARFVCVADEAGS